MPRGLVSVPSPSRRGLELAPDVIRGRGSVLTPNRSRTSDCNIPPDTTRNPPGIHAPAGLLCCSVVRRSRPVCRSGGPENRHAPPRRADHTPHARAPPVRDAEPVHLRNDAAAGIVGRGMVVRLPPQPPPLAENGRAERAKKRAGRWPFRIWNASKISVSKPAHATIWAATTDAPATPWTFPTPRYRTV